MKIILYGLFLFVSSLALASGEPTCSLKGTAVVYSNGLDSYSTDTAYAVFQLRLEASFLNPKIDTNKDLVTYEAHYNVRYKDNDDTILGEYLDFLTTATYLAKTIAKEKYNLTLSEEKQIAFITEVAGGFSLDSQPDVSTYPEIANSLLELTAQYLKGQIDNALVNMPATNASRLVEIYRSRLNSGKRILAVTHGEGSIISNAAYNLTFDPTYVLPGTDPAEDREKFSSAQIAPASALASSGVYRTLYTDSYYSRIYLKLVYSAPEPNFPFLGTPPGADKWNHGFISTYMAEGVKGPMDSDEYYGTLGGIIEAAELLKNECICKDSDGKEFAAFFHTNPDKTQGGLVSVNAFVSEEAYVGPDAVVCSFARVEDKAQIRDNAFVDNYATVQDQAIVSEWGKVGDVAFVGSNARISGEAFVGQNAIVYDSAKVKDRAILVGDSAVWNDSTTAGSALLYDKANVHDSATVSGWARVGGETFVGGRALVTDFTLVSGTGKVTVAGTAEIHNYAMAFDDVFVTGNARMYQSGLLTGSARITDNAIISGTSHMFGNSLAFEDARVENNSRMADYSSISGRAKIQDSAVMFERAFAKDDTYVRNSAAVSGDAFLINGAQLSDSAHIFDHFSIYELGQMRDNTKGYAYGRVSGSAIVSNFAHVFGTSHLFDYAVMYDSSLLSGNARAGGNARIYGSARVTGSAALTWGAVVCGSAYVSSGSISDNTFCK